jgi:two-component system sensor histidine kinase/response regulator
VMVVDDSATAADALLEMLSSFGIKADAADSGERALDMLARAVEAGDPYQVVLMDFMMPGWDGIETIRRIRADQRFAAPPAILMVSACTREEVAQKDSQVQPEGFLAKPVGPSLLYHSLLQVLRPDLAGLDAGAQGSPHARDLARLQGARILLVEDNANNREVALDFLAAAPVEVDVALHGGEAIEMVRDGDYDLVLMDIAMPDIDGLAASRRIRALDKGKTLPIVAMTAHAMAGDRENSLAAGMNDHITKPIDPEVMFRALLRWIDRTRLEGRRAPPATRLAADNGEPEQALPAVPGVDWEKALVSADRNMVRLHKRLRGFLREYGAAPQLVRDALESGRHEPLQRLVHNLKSSAWYLGATQLSTLSNSMEQSLRSGEAELAMARAPELVTTLESVLAGFALVRAPLAGAARAPADTVRLVQRLGELLRADDAQAEDVLGELQAVLAHARQEAVLAEIRLAIEDVEYAAALAALGRLAHAMEIEMVEAQ